MTKRSYSIASLTAAGALIAFAPLAAARTAASVNPNQEARETLKQVERMARDAAIEAEHLSQIARTSSVGPDSHITPLAELKQDINSMGRQIAALEAERDSLDPWERQAVDKVLPLLQETAANAQSAIVYYNENRIHLWTPDYHAYTEKIRADSDQIAKTLQNYLKYEKAHEAEQHLQAVIEGGAN